jgi:hypothetical protein
MPRNAFDPDEIDAILTAWAAKGDEERRQAGVIRDALRALSDDPVMAMLTRALDRSADATERMGRDVPAALTAMRGEMHESINQLGRSNTRSLLIMGALSLLLMAGLVGTQIVLTRGGIAVNSPTTTLPGGSP